MDRRSGSRDLVYCHECENEWFRDEHGLQCPRCHSEFIEVVDPERDPREDELAELPDTPPQPRHSVPDPDEDDISDMQWQRHGQGGTSFTYTSNRNASSQHGSEQGQLSPILGSFASMVGSMLGGRPSPGFQQQAGTQEFGAPDPSVGTSSSRRPSGPHYDRTSHQHTHSAPGTPGTGGSYTRSGGGPNFRWQITTSQGPLHARDANRPQPAGQDVEGLPPLLRMMFGPQPGVHGMPGVPGMPGMDPFQRHGGDPFNRRGLHDRHDDPFAAMGAFGPLFANILNPAMMRGGDAVYSQEALDRIVSQLMEQNATGNAPGPATEEAITSLPKRTINEQDLGSEGKAECSICMEEVNIGQQVTELPCHHWFHGECVKAWLTEHDTCPHCRQGIMPKDGPENASRPRNPHEAPRHDQMWGQGEGTQNSPFVIPDSPVQRRPGTRRRHSSAAGQSSSRRSSGGNDGLFSRMRNAFGGGNQ